MVLSDPALEQWQTTGDTFPLGILAELGEGAPSPHPNSCRWMSVGQSFMSICPSPPKCKSAGKILHVWLPWPGKLFWPSHAPSEQEKGITKYLVGRIQCSHNWWAWVCCAESHLKAPLCFQNALVSYQGQVCALEARRHWQTSSVLFFGSSVSQKR